MTLSNIIIAVVVLAAAAYILRHVVGLFKGTKGCCSGGCSGGCPSCCVAEKKSSEKQKPAEK